MPGASLRRRVTPRLQPALNAPMPIPTSICHPWQHRLSRRQLLGAAAGGVLGLGGLGGMVAPAMTELQLESAPAKGPGQHLVAQADPQNGQPADQAPGGVYRVVEQLGVSGADADAVEGSAMIGSCRSRHYPAPPSEPPSSN